MDDFARPLQSAVGMYAGNVFGGATARRDADHLRTLAEDDAREIAAAADDGDSTH